MNSLPRHHVDIIPSNGKKDASEIKPVKVETSGKSESYNIDLLNNVLVRCLRNIDVPNISVLDLSHCNLTTLPIGCKRLNLKRLNLSHNNLEQVPLCLYSGLKYLKLLDLSYNRIERFDLEPECLPYIKVIKLNNNRFENVPKWFLMFKCTNLEEFNYSNNKAKNYKYFKNSTNLEIMRLRKLELMNCYLIDNDYGFLKSFKLLKYLDISNGDRNFLNNFNELDDLFVKPRWKELHVLKLNGLSLSIFPEGIAWIYSLKELYITKNSLSWIPDSCEFLVNLEVLDISDNTVVAIPRFILTLEKLTTLRAANNFIQVVPDLSQLPCLKTLDLFHNSLDEVGFTITNISFVDLEYNYYDTDNIADLDSYNEKKDLLRKKYKVETRYDGPKLYPEEFESSPYDSEEEDLYREDKYTQPINNCLPTAEDEEEDWDVAVKVRNKNPEIDSVDDEWYGEEDKKVSSVRKTEYKVYVSDDDWMYDDVLEES